MKMTVRSEQLLAKFFQHHRSPWKSYRENATVVWEGEHYVLIRTGLGDDKSCDVYLVDKTGLLVDEKSAPLTQLAAGFHPSQTEAVEQPTLIHCSLTEAQEENETPLRGRWCKKRREQAIALAKRYEATYEPDFQDRAAAYEAQKRVEAEAEEREAAFLAVGRESIMVAFPDAAEHYNDNFRIPVVGDPDEDFWDVCVHENDERMVVNNLSLTLSQFRKLTTILKETT